MNGRIRVAVMVVTVFAVAGLVLSAVDDAVPPNVHGPSSDPLSGPWFALSDDLEDNSGGWFGGLTLSNPTDEAIDITGLWALDASDNLRLGPAWRGRGTPDPVIWPAIDPDRLRVTPLAGDARFRPGTDGRKNSIIVAFEIEPLAAATLRGFRIDYSHAGMSHSLYLDTFHCVAPSDAYHECEALELPDRTPLADIVDLPLTPITFAD